MNGGDPWVDDWERPLVVEEEIGLFHYHVNCVFGMGHYTTMPLSQTRPPNSVGVYNENADFSLSDGWMSFYLKPSELTCASSNWDLTLGPKLRVLNPGICTAAVSAQLRAAPGICLF